MTDERTIDVYNDRAADYAQVFDNQEPSEDLVQFMQALPKGGHILDLGCGTGGATAHMAGAGFEVTGMDASADMLRMAREKSAAQFVQGTFDDLDAVAAYDGVWANFSLLHAPREAMSGHLAAIATSLRGGGHLHLGMKLGTGSARDKLDRFYTYYSQAELTQLLGDAGFDVLEATVGESPGMAGSVEPWVILLARKSA